jgi:hypothetical protein
MSKARWQVGLTGAALSVGLLLSLSATAQATPTGTTGATGATGASGTNGKGQSFEQAKVQLEQQLNVRHVQLLKLTAEVNAASNLGASDKTTLLGRLSTETANISALIVKVPGDMTWAQLHADQASMYKDNRVFAVMTPQVNDAIVAGNELAMAASDQGNETMLSAEVTARASDAGFSAAMREYTQYVKLVAGVSTKVAALDTTIMAQLPDSYPHSIHVFDHARDALNNAGKALAQASSDQVEIQLFVEAYPVA